MNIMRQLGVYMVAIAAVLTMLVSCSPKIKGQPNTPPAPTQQVGGNGAAPAAPAGNQNPLVPAPQTATPVQTSSMGLTYNSDENSCFKTAAFGITAQQCSSSGQCPDFIGRKSDPDGIVISDDSGKNYVFICGKFFRILDANSVKNNYMDLGSRLYFSNSDLIAIFNRYPMAGNLPPNFMDDKWSSVLSCRESSNLGNNNNYEDALVADSSLSPAKVYVAFDYKLHYIENEAVGESHGIRKTELQKALFLPGEQMRYMLSRYQGADLKDTSKMFLNFNQ